MDLGKTLSLYRHIRGKGGITAVTSDGWSWKQKGPQKTGKFSGARMTQGLPRWR